MSDPAGRPAAPLAWLMSRFPAVSETFILQEILHAERQGARVEIFPLVRQRDETVHPEARALVDRARYARVAEPATLAAQAWWLRRAPRRYLRAWRRALAGNLRSPKFLSRALAVVPLAARFGREMHAAGVRHQHAHWATHPALAALVVHELTGIPYSFTAHAHDIQVDRTMLDQKLADARFIVTISEFNRRFLERRYGSIVHGKLHVIRCGIDLDRFPERPPPPRGPALRVLCVAGLRDYKGHTHLIRAVALLRDRGVDVRLELIGDGPLADELHAQCARDGVADRVDFRGALPGDEVARAMESADAFALPSIITANGKMEGLPVALMEAMARGMPVVASALSAIPELVEDDVTGLLVPPGDPAALADALQRLDADPALAGRLGAAGSARARAQHDIVANTARLLALIDGAPAPAAEA